MFRDRRNFRAIGFRAPDIRRTEELLALFPSKSVKRAERQPSVGERFEYLHCFYYSKQEFASFTLPPSYREKRKDGTYYRYNFYCLSLTIRKVRLYFVAVPFLPMALEVYPFIKSNTRGRNLFYQAADLTKLIEAVAEDRNMKGAVKVSKIKVRIDGDHLTDTMLFRGQDLPHSTSFNAALNGVSSAGPISSAEQVRIALALGDTRFSVEIDKDGHWKFWLTKDLTNLAGLRDVLAYLDSETLLRETESFPYMRALKAEAEGQDRD